MRIWADECSDLYRRSHDELTEQFDAEIQQLRLDYEAALAAKNSEKESALASLAETRGRWLQFGRWSLAQHICLFRVALNNTTLCTGFALSDPGCSDVNSTPVFKKWPAALQSPIQEYLDICFQRLSSRLGREVVANTTLELVPTQSLAAAFDDIASNPRVHELRCHIVYAFLTNTLRHQLDGDEIVLPGAIWHWARGSRPLSFDSSVPSGVIPVDDRVLYVPSPPQSLRQFLSTIQHLSRLIELVFGHSAEHDEARYHCPEASVARAEQRSSDRRRFEQRLKTESREFLKGYCIDESKWKQLVERLTAAGSGGSQPELVCCLLRFCNLGIHKL